MKSLDRRTMTLLIIHAALVLFNFALAVSGRLPPWAAFVGGLLAFNFSFTLWHECVHKTVSKSEDVCLWLGRLVAFLSLYPGYGSLRRVHLLHHKYQGDPQKDPIYPRVQCPPWRFPFLLAWTTLVDPLPPYPEKRLTAEERAADWIQYGLVAVLSGVFVHEGWGPAFLAAWVLPRVVIFPVHTFYVCYLPHSGHGKRLYETFRVVLRNPFTRYLTLYHCYHGLHHVWPTIPWYEYHATFRARRKELEARGVEILA
ncbi:MAG: fatty acid desaturase [Elusimicrobia bacterium]|nr:fatty acid desaturase [Elusimicrobiota bacterium]